MIVSPPAGRLAPVVAARTQRFAAFFVDLVLFSIVFVLAQAAYSTVMPFDAAEEEPVPGVVEGYLNQFAGDPAWPLTLALNAGFALYVWLSHARWGQTLGKRIFRLKLVTSDGEPLTTARTGVRAALYPALTAVPYAGLATHLIDALWIFADRDRRTLHDKLTGTVVVDLNPPSSSTGRPKTRIWDFLLAFLLVLLAIWIYYVVTILFQT
ncbi:RDD family protein [Sphaerisporangium sp. TRM90804]|uniref:RDD family protein n=1 Tax=Sphaerisporangium sp. TRM90804 TaxID=3031113 RepID=UPI00244A7838|nr:RDD family protein [Sphaerisporangium sp. TRM90804]MDH2423934.1 RDD family protein [Sphaerisporangium sp. TRM90804]